MHAASCRRTNDTGIQDTVPATYTRGTGAQGHPICHPPCTLVGVSILPARPSESQNRYLDFHNCTSLPLREVQRIVFGCRILVCLASYRWVEVDGGTRTVACNHPFGAWAGPGHIRLTRAHGGPMRPANPCSRAQGHPPHCTGSQDPSGEQRS